MLRRLPLCDVRRFLTFASLLSGLRPNATQHIPTHVNADLEGCVSCGAAEAKDHYQWNMDVCVGLATSHRVMSQRAEHLPVPGDEHKAAMQVVCTGGSGVATTAESTGTQPCE